MAHLCRSSCNTGTALGVCSFCIVLCDAFIKALKRVLVLGAISHLRTGMESNFLAVMDSCMFKINKTRNCVSFFFI